MQDFETIEDVMVWLEPLGYEAFWRVAHAQDLLDHEDRQHCDEALAKGAADFDTVLKVMKGVVRHTLVERHGLQYSTTIAPKPNLQLTH
jgi:hypothetical protein